MLDDGLNSYLYGLGRIGLDGGEMVYFHGDALGSVRQMTDVIGNIVYVSAYDPYGRVTHFGGEESSPYGYTGEYTDTSGLLYLRARFYDPNAGRFTSRDTFEGYYEQPLSLNRWNYGYSNPIRFTDHIGNDPVSDCLTLLAGLAIVDGPSFIGDIAGAVMCLAILGGAIKAYYAYDVPEKVADALEGVLDKDCSDWPDLYRRDNKPKPITTPKPAPNPEQLGRPLHPGTTDTPENKFVFYYKDVGAYPESGRSTIDIINDLRSFNIIGGEGTIAQLKKEQKSFDNGETWARYI